MKKTYPVSKKAREWRKHLKPPGKKAANQSTRRLGKAIIKNEPAHEPDPVSDLHTASVDDLVAILETRGLSWDLGNTGRMREARVWDWPNVIARHRPYKTEPLAVMLRKAMDQVNWKLYPIKSNV